MRIQLSIEPGARFNTFEIRKGMSIEGICEMMKDSLPYRVYVAKVNNRYEDLNYVVNTDCWIELRDMRSLEAAFVYRESIKLLFLTAAEKVLGDVRIIINNSLNQGTYIKVEGYKPVPEKIVKELRSAMDDLIARDVAFVKEYVPHKDVAGILESHGNLPKAVKLIRNKGGLNKLKTYVVDGSRHFTYIPTVPSASYITKYELRAYKNGLVLRYPNSHNPNELPEYREQSNLYNAFVEQEEWEQLLGVGYVADLNEKTRNGEFDELVQVSEALHEKKIAMIAEIAKRGNKKMILIAGPSSSGKTTTAMRLCTQLKVCGLDPLCLGTDDYFVERDETPLDEKGQPNFEGFEALDIKLFNSNMRDLIAGKEVDLPKFNFITGCKEFGHRITKLRPNQIIVIEGIHALNEKLTESIAEEDKYRVYVSPLTQLNIDEHNRVSTADTRILRRLVRDHRTRGKSADVTLSSWKQVRDGEDINIFPYSIKADIVFNSYHIYEIAVLKKYAEPLLKEIGRDQPGFAEANRILSFLNFFDACEDDSVIVNNSIIREFIGGSVYVD